MKDRYVKEDKLAALINENPLILMAMSRFGISLGFGDKTVEKICEHQNVDTSTFLAVINFITFGIVDIDDISVPSIIGYLDNAHAYFLDFCMPSIRRKLIEAIDCSGRDEIAMLVLKFYDEYVEEVRKHMVYETDYVFTYIKQLAAGGIDDTFSINVFAQHHHSIHSRLNELKDILVRYLPQKDNNLLNAALFDIINCEQDLMSHCNLEDRLLVPVVTRLEEECKTRRQHEAPVTTACDDTTDEQISQREREIIKWVAVGLSNKEIADKLSISVNTVTTHRRNLAQKLEIHSSAGLAIYAVINGIIDPNNLPHNV